MDLSDDGPDLAPHWHDAANNISGIARACRDAAPVAAAFVRAGWSSRSSSYDGYEVWTSWARLELDPLEGEEVLLNGVTDPEHVNTLATLLSRSGFGFVLEPSDDADELVREVRG
ncbi:hypothetical protein [Streptomyces sp. NPDC006552]|uniref:hypothetical protein n=1 Tax=Streptomyces sp. NPDC006552 TaxID=3157179 RepID=UPI0033A97698